jgi:glycosyltransferase involved in cell wall biosynthesis
VFIPAYNGGGYLRRCLESVLAQDADLEVVIGDDASTDDTLEVARSVADPRVQVHAFPERAGLAGNWNRTLALARGEYVILVGQDDRVDPGWARRLLGALEDHPEADLAFCRRRFEFEDEESRAVVGDFFENRYPPMLAPFYDRIGEVIEPRTMVEEAMRYCFEINLLGEPTFVMLRRDCEAVRRGFDAEMSQMIDWEFFTRCFTDRPILHVPEVLGTYHIHARASSIDNAPLSRHYREYDHLIEVVRRRFAGVLREDEVARLDVRQVEVKELARTWAEKEAAAARESKEH